MSKDKKTHTIHITFPVDEYEVIKSHCERVGLKPTLFARALMKQTVQELRDGKPVMGMEASKEAPTGRLGFNRRGRRSKGKKND